MKKSLVLLVFLLIPASFAIQTTFQEQYLPGQTIIAKISGNFLDSIEARDITLYSGRSFIPMTYSLGKIQEDYYFYGILPNQERNYTLTIKDVHFLELGQEKTQDLVFNFTASGNISIFSVKPGFIITSDDFTVQVTSKISNIDVVSTFLLESETISVKEGVTKTLDFLTDSVRAQTLTNLTLVSGEQEYVVPVYISKQGKPINYSQPKISLEFAKSYLNITVIKNTNFKSTFTLINNGQTDIENISFYSALGIVKFSPNKIDFLYSSESKEIELTVSSKNEGESETTIQAKYSNASIQIPLFITTLNNEDYQDFINNSDISDISEEQTCEELSGKICGDLLCHGNVSLTSDGELCCIGTCKSVSSGGGGSRWIWIIVIIIILLGLGFLIYKKTKLKKSSSREVIVKTAEDYESRFKQKSEEKKGSLSTS